MSSPWERKRWSSGGLTVGLPVVLPTPPVRGTLCGPIVAGVLGMGVSGLGGLPGLSFFGLSFLGSGTRIEGGLWETRPNPSFLNSCFTGAGGPRGGGDPSSFLRPGSGSYQSNDDCPCFLKAANASLQIHPITEGFPSSTPFRKYTTSC